MNLEEKVYSVLVVSAADNFNSSLQALLPDSKFAPVKFVANVSSAKRTLLEKSFDFVIINSPLPDDTGTRFAIDICSEKSGIALLMVRSELYTATYNKVVPHGVYLLPKPTAKPIVSQAVDWLIATRERLRRLDKKTVTIEEKMQEIRIVNRAKWMLIENMQIAEADAHRYIEKQAMDRCVSKRDVAEEIIKTYT
ncbi:MAG: ANTAR domain-containing protein [Acutalibacteraceae bacterium]|nr:ANTAR domain-containing protein [Acutalibacteraceae bacterium]